MSVTPDYPVYSKTGADARFATKTEVEQIALTPGPQGPAGAGGSPGTAATISGVSAVSTPHTEQAGVENVGTTSAADFRFYIPRGVPGDVGPAGPEGPAGDPSSLLSLAFPDDLPDTGGEYIPARRNSGSNSIIPTGNTYFTFFSGRRTETITRLRISTAHQAQAGATHVAVGMFNVSDDGLSMTRFAVWTDATLFSASWTSYVLTFPTPFEKIAGKRYAMAVEHNATTSPAIRTSYVNDSAQHPRVTGNTWGMWIRDSTDPKILSTLHNSGIGESMLYFALLP